MTDPLALHPADPCHEHTDLGGELYQLACELYPLHRAITGAGLRATFARLGQELPLQITEVPTGTPVLDWIVPDEWRIRDAFVRDLEGQRVIDYRQSNLHVVSYSQPIQRRMSWRELTPHLHSLPNRPDAIPYRTSFFDRSWGFCLPHRRREQLDAAPDALYEVVIDSELFPGALSFAECLLPGTDSDEVLLYAHACHPSLANDNLSGMVVATAVGRLLAQRARRLSYRIVFAPATIGAIAWLASRRAELSRVRHGLVLSLLGDAAPLSYKRSRQGDTELDRAVTHMLWQTGHTDRISDYSPVGYDERQFGSPGFDLPVGCLMRSRPGTFPEYHTSDDSLALISPASLADAAGQIVRILDVLEHNRAYRNLRPYGEPMLGRYDLYRAYGQADDRGQLQMAILWTLNLSDGRHRLLDIAERAGLPFALIHRAAELLSSHQLLAPIATP